MLLPVGAADLDEWLSEPDAGVAGCLTRHGGPYLVLGAGGKIGLHLCRMLRRGLDAAGRTDRVIAVSRFSSLRVRDEFARGGVEVLAGDLCDPAVVRALPDAATIFFLAGVKFHTADQPAVLRRFNVEMPGLIAERFRAARIVAFSSGCVYPFVSPETGGASESTRIAPHGAYAESCVGREQVFQAASDRYGTAIALLRLNYAVEVRYGVLLDIALRVAHGQPVDVSTGYCNVIWQRDAVSHAIQSLDMAASPTVPLNITGAEILSVRELAQRFGELLGREVRWQGTEAPTAWLSDARQSHQRFGPPSTRVADMLAWVAAWVRQGGDTWDKPTGFERRDGRF